MANETLVDRVINELTDGWDNPNFGKHLKHLQLLRELETLKPELKSLLEEELTKAELKQRKAEYGPILESVMRIVAKTVYEAVQSRIDGKTIRTVCHTVVEPYSRMYGDESVEVGADIYLFTGSKSPRGFVVSDYKYLSRDALGLKAIILNGFDPNSKLVLRRDGKSKLVDSKQTILSPKGEPVNFLHKVHARYSVIMPQETAQAVYNQLSKKS